MAIADSNKNRRKAYIDKIEPLLPIVAGLEVQSCEVGDFSVILALGNWTPFDSFIENDSVSLVFGDAIEPSNSRRVSAARLRNLWGDFKNQDPFDGIHVAINYNQNGELIVGTDLLGIFPIYYFVSKEVVMLGSSPELFRYHPCFEMKINPKGLVGLLLTKGIVNGNTLLSGVKRLGAGYLFRCNSDFEASEIAQFKFTMSTKYFDKSLSEQVEIVDKAFKEAILRQVPKNEKCCIMLSGGIDSTLVAGYLERTGYDIVALTEGLANDNEMRCAKQIANTLGFKHVSFNVGYNNYEHYSDLAVNWQHLSEGLTSVPFWRFYRSLRKENWRVITGFCGDAVFGTIIDRALRSRSGNVSFEGFFDNINKEGFAPKVIEKLLKREYCDGLVSQIINELRNVCDSYPGLEFQRVLGFGLNQKTRFNDLCGIWALSFGAWPILPFTDHKILEVIGGLPLESLVDRKLERELLRIKFPKIASLNLAGNSLDPTPLVENFQYRVRQKIYGSSGIWKIALFRQIRNQLFINLRGETRYWLRQYLFDSPGWVAIRKKAEPYLQMTTSLLNKKAIEELMPSSNSNYMQVVMKMKAFGVNITSSLRIILGLSLWLQNHYDAVTNFDPSLNRKKQETSD